MEKSRLIIGAVALIAIGMVFSGIGYAVVSSYTGQTTAEESTDVNYVTVALGAGQYVGTVHKLYYDTVNEAGTITYTLKEGFTIQYDVTITAVPKSTSVAALTASLPEVSVSGATVSWQIQDVNDSDDDGDSTEYIPWDGSSVNISLAEGQSSSSATVGVRLVVTPGQGVTSAPSATASFGVTFTATETV